MTSFFILHVWIIIFYDVFCVLYLVLYSFELKVLPWNENLFEIIRKLVKIFNLKVDRNIVDHPFKVSSIGFCLVDILQFVYNFRICQGTSIISRFEDNLLKKLFVIFTIRPNPLTYFLLNITQRFQLRN